MKSNLAVTVKQNAARTLYCVLAMEILFFLLSTTGKVEGVARAYWEGVRLRLSSGNYWARAALAGIVFAILLTLLQAFASYFARFVKSD